MRTLFVSSAETGVPLRYPIHIGSNLLAKTSELVDLKNFSKIVVVADEKLVNSSLTDLKNGLPKGAAVLKVTGSENEKKLTSVESVWKFFSKNHLDRNSLVFTLGGGALGDMAGFAASTYMRGISYIHVPTTLVSQVDASIGGKVGVNFAGVKNLIGSFHHPHAVIIDPATLKSLPAAEFISGFGEILKHGLIKDAEYFEVGSSMLHPTPDTPQLEELIARSCKIKSDVVCADPFEKGARKLLNFGHTVGHALEALALESEEPLLHGEAVGLGIIVESAISIKKGLLEDKYLEIIISSLKTVGLPTKISSAIDYDAAIEKMLLDKKNRGGSIRCVLLKEIGEAVYDVEVSAEEVKSAMEILH
jgi:3-dehydroquinate synthase